MQYQNNTAFVQLHQVNVSSNIAGWLSLLAATAALLTAPVLRPTASSFALATAIGSSLGAVASFRSASNTSRTLDDYSDITSQNAQTNLYTDTLNKDADTTVNLENTNRIPSASGLDSGNQAVFDWKLFETNRTEYPHLSIVAGTGAGKSTLAEWLCTLLGGRTIAVAPHWETGDYDGADLIIGAGRRYGTSAEPYEVTEDKKGNPVVIGETEVDSPDESTTVMQFLNWLAREMDRRYQLDSMGKRVNGEALNVILDEIPSYSGLPGYKDVLRVLIREARKVNIRLILMLQGQEVVAFGFQGEGQLRDNLTQILVGKFALNEAAMKARTSKGAESTRWEQIYEILEGYERCALVEDVPACIPTITKIEDAPRPEMLPKDSERLYSIILTVASNRGEAIRPSDVSRYNRAAKGVSAAVINGLFLELERDGRGTVDDKGRFTAADNLPTTAHLNGQVHV